MGKENKEVELTDIYQKLQDVIDLNADLQKELKEKDKIINKLNKTYNVNDDRYVEVGCYDLNGIVLSDRNGRYRVPVGYGEVVEMKASELREVFISNNRKWAKFFESGLLYFVDEDEYEQFKVKPKFIMSDENLIEVCDLPQDKFIEKLNDITDKRRNDKAFVVVLWRIIKLISERKVNLSYENKAVMESYYLQKIEDLLTKFKVFQEVKNIK